VNSFSPETAHGITTLRLQTTTKGMATGIIADAWNMNETLPVDIGFAPWNPLYRGTPSLTPEVLSAIHEAAQIEIEQDFNAQCCLDSMYFSGKGLAKCE
jgi:endo-1,3(4)-beta-glucanase